MTDASDAIDPLAQETKAVTGEVADPALDAAESVADSTRELARNLFDEITRARAKAAKRAR